MNSHGVPVYISNEVNALITKLKERSDRLDDVKKIYCGVLGHKKLAWEACSVQATSALRKCQQDVARLVRVLRTVQELEQYLVIQELFDGAAKEIMDALLVLDEEIRAASVGVGIKPRS